MAATKGPPKLIAQVGLGAPVDPLAVATEGLLIGEAGEQIFVYTASGGLQIGGQALNETTYTVLVAGGMAIGGDTDDTEITQVFQGTGTVSIEGADADVNVTFTITAEDGVITGGDSPFTTVIGNNTFYTYPASGREPIVTDGDAHVTTVINGIQSFFYQPSGGAIAGGNAENDTEVTLVAEGDGGLNTGGNTDDTTSSRSFISDGNKASGQAGIVTGGAIPIQKGQRSGMGAPRPRRRTAQPHHYIYKAWADRHTLVSGGAADVVFRAQPERIPVGKVGIFDIFLLPDQKPFEPTRTFKDFYEDFSADKQEVPEPVIQELLAQGGAVISGSAKIDHHNQREHVLTLDEDLIFTLEMLNEDNEVVYEAYYDKKEQKLRKDDEDIILALLD